MKDSLTQYLFVNYKPHTYCIRKQSGNSGVRRRGLTSCFPWQRPEYVSKAANVEFVVDKMSLKIIVGKIREGFLKHYSILGCDALNFNARTCTQDSDKKTYGTYSFTKPHGVATSQGSDIKGYKGNLDGGFLYWRSEGYAK
jgi:hypothetical protein